MANEIREPRGLWLAHRGCSQGPAKDFLMQTIRGILRDNAIRYYEKAAESLERHEYLAVAEGGHEWDGQ